MITLNLSLSLSLCFSFVPLLHHSLNRNRSRLLIAHAISYKLNVLLTLNLVLLPRQNDELPLWMLE